MLKVFFHTNPSRPSIFQEWKLHSAQKTFLEGNSIFK